MDPEQWINSGDRCTYILFALQQFAYTKQAFQDIPYRVQQRNFTIRERVVVEPSVVTLLRHDPVRILNRSLDEFVFIELTAGKGESPGCSRVITLNTASGQHREVLAPGSVAVLDRNQPLRCTPH